MTSKRINVTLDGEYAERLSRLARRAHVSDGTLARSLLSSALDEADPDPQTVTEILEGIPGFTERVERAERDIAEGRVIELDEL